MTDDPRRTRDDRRRASETLLSDIDKGLALVEQAQRLGDTANEHRWTLLERSIEGLTIEVRKYAELSAAGAAELSGSAAGRQVARHIDELSATVADHETFILETRGALRLARWAMGSSLLALVASVLGIVRELAR